MLCALPRTDRILTGGQDIEAAIAAEHGQYGFEVKALGHHQFVKGEGKAIKMRHLRRQEGRRPVALMLPKPMAIQQLFGWRQQLLRIRSPQPTGGEALVGLSEQILETNGILERFRHGSVGRHIQRDAPSLLVLHKGFEFIPGEEIHILIS
jgi:hypothetical protein